MSDSSNNPNTRVNAMAPGASTSPVEWSRPIEAVHPDGRVLPVSSSHIDGEGDYMVSAGGGAPRDWCDGYHRPDGRSTERGDAWRIRNVQPTTPELDPALWDRMVAFVRRCDDLSTAECFVGKANGHTEEELAIEARAIVADLPKPVDPDLIEARKLAASFSDREDVSHADYLSGDLDSGGEVQAILAAIKRGRELATPEVSHVG